MSNIIQTCLGGVVILACDYAKREGVLPEPMALVAIGFGFVLLGYGAAHLLGRR